MIMNRVDYGTGLTMTTEQIDYIKEADMVWIARDGYLHTIPRGLRSTAVVLKCLPPPNKYWYKVLQTTPSGKTQVKTYPIDMLTKIEDND